MKKTKVLIVGAGPTGLMMASQLSLHKIPFIIVEKMYGPTTQSRALGIQARTLEIFAQMGISDIFVKEGQPAHGANFIAEGKIVEHVPLSKFGQGLTAFPYLLILEQSRTEEILIDFIKSQGQKIFWNTEVVSFTQDKDKVHATIKTKDEKEEIYADWIIGADGAHSIVRHTLGIPLAGKTYKQSLFVLDCKIDSSLPETDIAVAFSKIAFAAFFPMSNHCWRIVGEIPDRLIGKDEITFEDVNKDFAERIKIKMTLSDPLWISLYHSHHRCVASFKEGRSFLLGDAANIHSPVGAQGMNTGLQDAYNLAWKLAFIYTGKAQQKILETYNPERLPFAKKLVETTDRVFNIAIGRSFLSVILREHLLPFILKIGISHNKTREFLFKTVSQIGISYHTSPLSKNASLGNFSSNAPVPGDRLPYLFFQKDGKEVNIQDLIGPFQMTLLLFSIYQTDKDFMTDSLKKYKHVIKIIHISDKSLYSKFGLEKNGYFLIRPDMYIAFRSNSLQRSELIDYLSEYFRAKEEK